MREGLIGFTLGELGILIAFVLIFFVAADREPPIAFDVDSLQARVETVEDSVAILLDSIRNLAGRAACKDKEIIDGFLFSAAVAGANQYVIRGDTLSFEAIRDRFAVQIAEAEEARCRHQVELLAPQSLSASDFAKAQRLGRQLFYVFPRANP